MDTSSKALRCTCKRENIFTGDGGSVPKGQSGADQAICQYRCAEGLAARCLRLYSPSQAKFRFPFHLSKFSLLRFLADPLVLVRFPLCPWALQVLLVKWDYDRFVVCHVVQITHLAFRTLFLFCAAKPAEQKLVIAIECPY